ncbi:MAG: hypothetical protein ACM3SQ_17040 [Betaproteobacteria bacterium]
MVIKAAAGRQIDTLIADLASASDVTREAAVARLTIIGGRAVERLMALTDSDTRPEARAAALRALHAIGDPRALGPAVRAASAANAATATAAIVVLRGLLRSALGAAALDALTAQALDRARAPAVRAAAVEALGDLDPDTRAPLWNVLADDPEPAVRAVVEAHARGTPPPGPARGLADLAEGPLPDDPDALRRAIARAPARTSLTTLQELVNRIREREAIERPPRRGAWSSARAAAHLALAARNSRLALYDLREWLQQAEGPLPVDAIAALEQIGDESCLEPIAAAYAKATVSGRSGHDWWREHLADAFRAIAKRERVTRRHAVARRIATRWGAAAELWPHRSRS